MNPIYFLLVPILALAYISIIRNRKSKSKPKPKFKPTIKLIMSKPKFYGLSGKQFKTLYVDAKYLDFRVGDSERKGWKRHSSQLLNNEYYLNNN